VLFEAAESSWDLFHSSDVDQHELAVDDSVPAGTHERNEMKKTAGRAGGRGWGGSERSEGSESAGSRAHDNVTCRAHNYHLLLSEVDASAAEGRLVAVQLDAIGYLQPRVTRALAAASQPAQT